MGMSSKTIPAELISLEYFAEVRGISVEAARRICADVARSAQARGERNLLEIYDVGGVEYLSRRDADLWRRWLAIQIELMRPDPED